MSRRPGSPLAIAAAVLLMLARPAFAAGADVSIVDNGYAPATVHVAVGGTVTWTDNGNNPHSVTADDGSFDSSPNCSGTVIAACLSNGATFPHTFNSPGTFRYYCHIHGAPGGSGMSGTVIVDAPTTPTTTPTPTHTTPPPTTPHTTPPTTPAPTTTPPTSASPSPTESVSPTPSASASPSATSASPGTTVAADAGSKGSRTGTVVLGAIAVILILSVALAFVLRRRET